MTAESTNTGNKLLLDDLTVGQKFHSGTYTITADQIKTFAGEFDPQPAHLDEEEAKETFFGELVASGWHTAAISMRLLVGSVPIEGGLVGAGGDISWLRPTRPGDILQLETEIIDIRPSRSRPDRGQVKVRSLTRNQQGKTLQIMSSLIVVPRRKP